MVIVLVCLYGGWLWVFGFFGYVYFFVLCDTPAKYSRILESGLDL